MKNNRWMTFAAAGLMIVGFSQSSFASGDDLATCKIKGTDLRVLIEFYLSTDDGSMYVDSVELSRVVGMDSYGDEELVNLGTIDRNSGTLDAVAEVSADKKSAKFTINAVDRDGNLLIADMKAKQSSHNEDITEIKGRINTTFKKANDTITAEYPNLNKAKIECTYF